MEPVSEFFDGAGQPRPHQKLLADFLARHSDADRARIASAVQGRLREQEVSYNILSAPDGAARRWLLDEVPHVIDGEEFDQLSRRVAERAELLEACLQDFYGPQRLLREGIVPAEVLLGNPHFFRSLHGFHPGEGRRLPLYAADVVNTPEHGYLVHSDRTTGPAGSGYALENRLTMGQVLAEPFVQYRVRKLNRFFRHLTQTVSALCPRGGDDPNIVLLSPGVHDESSFEHAYLARYLGFDLVEGRDLTVRGEKVFLKTLEGLKRVDVMLRRIGDDWCDPLELREDSVLGVPGLVSAARAQKVAMANPLGSAIVESPAIRAYLPRIAQALSGAPLSIDSVPTRFLGDKEQRSEVLASLDSWVVRPAFGDRRAPAIMAAKLSAASKAELLARIETAPGDFVAEKWPETTRVPVGLDQKRDGALSMRLFGVYNEDRYSIMAGGLGRVDDSPDGLFLRGASAPMSKDIWVAGNDAGIEPELPKMPDRALQIRRGGIDLPSRLFDDIFWLGRHTQRCICAARLIRAGLEPSAAEEIGAPRELQEAIPRTLGALQILKPGRVSGMSLEEASMTAIYDVRQYNSIRATLRNIHSLTTATRSRLSSDMWGVLRRSTELYGASDETNVSPQEAFETLDELLVCLSAFHGITSSNMVRGHAWVFLEMGRRIEQGVFVFTLLKDLFGGGQSRILMDTSLRVCDSLLTYRARYLSKLQATPVADLILTDDSNPQSALFQIRRMLTCVRALPTRVPFPLSRAETKLVSLEARLVTLDLESACRDAGAELTAFAEDAIKQLWKISDDLTQLYFIHASPPRALAPTHWIGAGLEADT